VEICGILPINFLGAIKELTKEGSCCVFAYNLKQQSK
jgi:hypothetical protein